MKTTSSPRWLEPLGPVLLPFRMRLDRKERLLNPEEFFEKTTYCELLNLQKEELYALLNVSTSSWRFRFPATEYYAFRVKHMPTKRSVTSWARISRYFPAQNQDSYQGLVTPLVDILTFMQQQRAGAYGPLSLGSANHFLCSELGERESGDVVTIKYPIEGIGYKKWLFSYTSTSSLVISESDRIFLPTKNITPSWYSE